LPPLQPSGHPVAPGGPQAIPDERVSNGENHCLFACTARSLASAASISFLSPCFYQNSINKVQYLWLGKHVLDGVIEFPQQKLDQSHSFVEILVNLAQRFAELYDTLCLT
jgi:hypothetical protein